MDLDLFRLPAELVGDLSIRRRPPRHRQGECFIKGPVPYAWVSSACRLPGAGLNVAMMSRFLCGRYRSPNRWGLEAISKGLGISIASARRGLDVAEQAGLLTVKRVPGRKLAISIRGDEATSASSHRPLYGPIPWAWWLRASHLSAKASQVAAACWLLAGWGQSASFEMVTDCWSDFGLNRYSIRRGLLELEAARLVTVARTAGRPAIVTLQEAA